MKTTQTKVDQGREPISRESTLTRNNELLRRCVLPRVNIQPTAKRGEGGFETARETVRILLSTLSPTPWPVANCSPDPKSALLSHDLAVLRKTIASIMGAVDQEVITRAEADAVINFLTEGFVSRRINDVFTSVATPSGSWFCVAHRSAHSLP